MIRSLIVTTTLALSTTAFACGPLLKNYPFECALADRYQTVKDTLKNDHNVDAEFTVANRALRLIDNDEYEKRKDEVRYMPWKIYEPAPVTWQLWERGAARVEEMVADPNLQTITIDELEHLNKLLINKQMMTFLSKLKGNKPGQIRSAKIFAPPGAQFKCDENPMDDQDFRLLQNYDLKDYDGEPLMRLKGVKKCKGNGYGLVIWYMPGDKVKKELQRLLDDFNASFDKYLAGDQMNRSPVEFIVDFQRWFIAIHPFGDGNGRTSRFIQDMFMKKLGLPFIPTGRVSMLADRNSTVRSTKKELEKSVEYLEGCLGGYAKRKSNGRTKLYGHCVPIYDDADTGEDSRSKAERQQFGADLKKFLQDSDV